MILNETNLVTLENGPRPAGLPTSCFYCHCPIGALHNPECPLRLKTVLVDVTLSLVLSMPQCFTHDDIEYHLNESSLLREQHRG